MSDEILLKKEGKIRIYRDRIAIGDEYGNIEVFSLSPHIEEIEKTKEILENGDVFVFSNNKKLPL